jgi:hypothetical protein
MTGIIMTGIALATIITTAVITILIIHGTIITTLIAAVVPIIITATQKQILLITNREFSILGLTLAITPVDPIQIQSLEGKPLQPTAIHIMGQGIVLIVIPEEAAIQATF